MTTNNSPKLDSYVTTDPQSNPGFGSSPTRSTKPLIAIMLVSILVLLLVNIRTHNLLSIPGQRGSISGRVLIDSDSDYPVKIVVLGTDISVYSDDEGSFTIDDVPSGAQALVVLGEYTGIEIRVDVQPSVTNSVGEISLRTTSLPPGSTTPQR